MGIFKDETGNTYGRLEVIERGSSEYKGCVSWACICTCGNKVVVRGTALRDGTTKSCGCYNKDVLRSQVAEKNPCWRGGVTMLGQPFRQNKRYKEWRKTVLDIHGNCCKLCKASKKLEVHHIFNFNDFPEKQIDLSNGLILCKACHAKFHSIYGKVQTNFSQVIEYLGGMPCLVPMM